MNRNQFVFAFVLIVLATVFAAFSARSETMTLTEPTMDDKGVALGTRQGPLDGGVFYDNSLKECRAFQNGALIAVFQATAPQGGGTVALPEFDPLSCVGVASFTGKCYNDVTGDGSLEAGAESLPVTRPCAELGLPGAPVIQIEVK